MYLLRRRPAPDDLYKSHIRQYTRMDGTVVAEHDDKRTRKHPDILRHENAHGDQVHAGSKLAHGSDLLDHLKEKGWKHREVAAVTKDADAKVGKKEDIPEPPKIKGANQENTALVSAQRIINRMHETAKTSEGDPSAALIAMTSSRSNGYLAAIDSYREQLLNHFGHKVDRESTHHKYEKGGHTLIVSKDGDKHTVEFAGSDAENDVKGQSVHGRSQHTTVDTGKKEPKFIMGRENASYTAKMNKIDSTFALVEMSDLTTSHTHDGHVNTAYPQDIQPRDRARIASRIQIQDIANNIKPELLESSGHTSDGAPIVGKDGIVESGNGRTIALGLAYKIGKGEEYRQYLHDHAEHFGLKTEDVAKMEHPVIVRVRKTEVDRPEFAREANQSNLMHNSPVETAFSDAERITDAMMAKYQPDEDGDVLVEENKPFINDFLATLGKNEAAGLKDKYGEPNKKMIERVQAAVFAKVYKSEVLTELMVESADSDVRNIINAMSASAGTYAKIQQHSDLDVTHELLESIDHIRSAKRNKGSIDDQLAQASFDDDGKAQHVGEVTEDLTRAVHALKGSRRKLSEFFKLLTDKANQEIVEREDADQYGATDIFGNARDKKDKGAIVKETAQETANVNKSQGHPGTGPEEALHDRRSARRRQQGQGQAEKEEVAKAHVHDYDRTTASGALVHVQSHEDSRIRKYGEQIAGAQTQLDLHKVRQNRLGTIPHYHGLNDTAKDKVLAAEQERYSYLKRRDDFLDSKQRNKRESQKKKLKAGATVSHKQLLASGLAERTKAGTQLLMFRSQRGTASLHKSDTELASRLFLIKPRTGGKK
jgi:hypothetical protein